jgi:hypothetical protein
MKLKTILLALLGTSALAAAPAFADRDHRGHGNGHAKHHWKQHGHHNAHHAGHFRGHSYHARPVVVVPPRVVYRAPAPVYYAPPVVHRPAPSFGAGTISIRLNLPL